MVVTNNIELERMLLHSWRDLDCEARNREQDAILCDRNADCREECVRRQSRPSLQ
jgi:hypothetical protein